MPEKKDNSESKPKRTTKKTARKSTTDTDAKTKSDEQADIQQLTPDEVNSFHQRLLLRRRELLGDMGQMQGEALEHNQTTSGELSSMPVHMADVGTDNYEQEFTLGLIDSERKMLNGIDHALTKIDDGTYGICEGTGNLISKARLDAKPYARYCVEYARMLEKGLVVPGNEDV